MRKLSGIILILIWQLPGQVCTATPPTLLMKNELGSLEENPSWVSIAQERDDIIVVCGKYAYDSTARKYFFEVECVTSLDKSTFETKNILQNPPPLQTLHDVSPRTGVMLVTLRSGYLALFDPYSGTVSHQAHLPEIERERDLFHTQDTKTLSFRYGKISIYDFELQSETEIMDLGEYWGFNSGSFSSNSDRTRIAYTIHMSRVSDGIFIDTESHTSTPFSVAFTNASARFPRNSDRLFTVGAPSYGLNTLYEHDSETGTITRQLVLESEPSTPGREYYGTNASSFLSENGKYMYAFTNNRVFVVDVENWIHIHTAVRVQQATSIIRAFPSDDGQMAVAVDRSGTITQYRPIRAEPIGSEIAAKKYSLQLRFQTKIDSLYAIEKSSDLHTWTSSDPIESQGLIALTPTTLEQSPRFWRVYEYKQAIIGSK